MSSPYAIRPVSTVGTTRGLGFWLSKVPGRFPPTRPCAPPRYPWQWRWARWFLHCNLPALCWYGCARLRTKVLARRLFLGFFLLAVGEAIGWNWFWFNQYVCLLVCIMQRNGRYPLKFSLDRCLQWGMIGYASLYGEWLTCSGIDVFQVYAFMVECGWIHPGDAAVELLSNIGERGVDQSHTLAHGGNSVIVHPRGTAQTTGNMVGLVGAVPPVVSTAWPKLWLRKFAIITVQRRPLSMKPQASLFNNQKANTMI